MTARTPAERLNGTGKTAQSYIAGIGASGALLAGAVVAFVFLVGAVSFEVWPQAAERDGGAQSLGVAELSGPSGPSGGAAPATATLGETVSLLAATVPTTVDAPAVALAGDAGIKGGGDVGGGGGGGGDGDDGDGDGGDTGGGGGTGGTGTAGGDPNDPGPSTGENPESDRPTGSNPRPDRPSNGGSTGSGSTAGTPSVPSGSGDGEDRPSGGGGDSR